MIFYITFKVKPKAGGRYLGIKERAKAKIKELKKLKFILLLLLIALRIWHLKTDNPEQTELKSNEPL